MRSNIYDTGKVKQLENIFFFWFFITSLENKDILKKILNPFMTETVII